MLDPECAAYKEYIKALEQTLEKACRARVATIRERFKTRSFET